MMSLALCGQHGLEGAVESFSDGVPLGVISCHVVECDGVLQTKLLEGLGCELASVVKDDAVWDSKVCYVLCASDPMTPCVFLDFNG